MSSRATVFAFVVSFAVGCFQNHSTDVTDDAPRVDAGPSVDGGPSTCDCCGTTVAAPPEGCWRGICDPWCLHPDMGHDLYSCDCCGVDVTSPEPCHPGVCEPYCGLLECEPRALDALCDHSFVPAGIELDLPVLFGDASGESCFCAESIQCRVTVGDTRVMLETDVCADPDIDCDGCTPFVEGTCRIPPLDARPYDVMVNGEYAFVLDVAPPDVVPEWGLSCATRGQSGGECGTLWPPRAETPSYVCHALEAGEGQRVAIEVAHECPACNAPAGPCEVDIFDDVIRVRTSTLDPSCDIACPPACFERIDTCLTPRLPAGTWRVSVEGLDGYESRLVVGDGPTGPGSACGPVTPGG